VSTELPVEHRLESAVGVSSGACIPYVTVDQWDLDNISNPAAHLRAAPADGTVVKGLPSQTYWAFRSGYRPPTGPNPIAVGVDDRRHQAEGLPGARSAGGKARCKVPNLKHMTLRQAERALRQAHCHLGELHRPRHVTRHRVLGVTKQSARPRSNHTANFPVNVTLG
jgi:hypothetical protein